MHRHLNRLASVKYLIHRLTRYVFMAGMGWVLLLMLLTTCDAATRYLFSSPVPGANELSKFMLAIFGMLGMAYTQHEDGNIRVTLLTDALPHRLKAVFGLISNFLSLGIVGLIVWGAWKMGVEEFHMGITSDALKIPLYPLKFILSAGAFFLCLEILIDIAESADELRIGN